MTVISNLYKASLHLGELCTEMYMKSLHCWKKKMPHTKGWSIFAYSFYNPFDESIQVSGWVRRRHLKELQMRKIQAEPFSLQNSRGVRTLIICDQHPLKSMASGPLKIKKGTRPVLILATYRHTTESVGKFGPSSREGLYGLRHVRNKHMWLRACTYRTDQPQNFSCNIPQNVTRPLGVKSHQMPSDLRPSGFWWLLTSKGLSQLSPL